MRIRKLQRDQEMDVQAFALLWVGWLVVVLGLISSKEPALEPVDQLRRRIDEAARYVPIENLAIAPQCGFASTMLGNLLTWDEQRRKLELVVETARKVWG